MNEIMREQWATIINSFDPTTHRYVLYHYTPNHWDDHVKLYIHCYVVYVDGWEVEVMIDQKMYVVEEWDMKAIHLAINYDLFRDLIRLEGL